MSNSNLSVWVALRHFEGLCEFGVFWGLLIGTLIGASGIFPSLSVRYWLESDGVGWRLGIADPCTNTSWEDSLVQETPIGRLPWCEHQHPPWLRPLSQPNPRLTKPTVRKGTERIRR